MREPRVLDRSNLGVVERKKHGTQLGGTKRMSVRERAEGGRIDAREQHDRLRPLRDEPLARWGRPPMAGDDRDVSGHHARLPEQLQLQAEGSGTAQDRRE